MTNKKQGGNVREGDIREHSPLRKIRIDEVRKQEAEQELEEYRRRYQEYVKEWEEERQGQCGEWETKCL